MAWPRRLLVSSAVKAGNFRGRKSNVAVCAFSAHPAAQRGRVPAIRLYIGVVGASLQERRLKLLGLEFGVQQWNGENSWTAISGLPTTRRVTGGIAGFEHYYEGVAQ